MDIINTLPETFALSTVAFVVGITQIVKMLGWAKDNYLALVAVLTGAIVNPLINGEAFAEPFSVQALVLSILTGMLIGAITAGAVNLTNQTARKIAGTSK